MMFDNFNWINEGEIKIEENKAVIKAPVHMCVDSLSIFFGKMSLRVLYSACLFVCFLFLGPHPWHMEVPRLGVRLEL